MFPLSILFVVCFAIIGSKKRQEGRKAGKQNKEQAGTQNHGKMKKDRHITMQI